MADLDFDAQLSRLYADPPPLPDNDAFVQRVSGRLDRGWALRRLAIAVVGAGAGIIGAYQLVSSRLFADVQLFSRDSAKALGGGYSHLSGQAGELLSLTGGGAEVMWMGAALAALAVAFAVTRAVDQF
jgi:hypothetical protein